MGTRGVFSLNRVIQKKYINDWVNLSNVWIDQIPNTGYFGGGSPGPRTTMDKTTYSLDTTVTIPGAALSSARSYLAATGSTTAGYFGGGSFFFNTPPEKSTMDKLTYSSDTTTAIPNANLTVARFRFAASSSSTAGYFGGGFPTTSQMDKLTYSTDTTAPAPSTANLSFGRDGFAATGNSTAGYFGGGSPSTRTTMDKVTYSSDTRTTLPASGSLSLARFVLAATGNSTAGYFGGGGIPAAASTMDKITYSTDTREAVPGANLSVNRSYLAATGNSSVGYFGGGFPGPKSSMDKITYSSDTTVAVPGAVLSAGRSEFAASSARANALPGTWRRFSDGSTTTNPASLPPATPTPQTAGTPTPNTGYFAGGSGASPGLSSFIKFSYATELSNSIPSTNLVQGRGNFAAAGNSINSYFNTGRVGTLITVTDRLTYLTDTTISIPSLNLSVIRQDYGATGNSTAGYFGGGATITVAGEKTIVEKLVYSSELISATPTANLSFARTILAATGTSTAGYFAGGSNPSIPLIYSRTDKLTYSTDNTAPVPTANLSLARWALAATGSSTAGYFGGGFDGSVRVSTMDKLTYSTDLTAAVPTASLSVARLGIAATGNTTNGYFGGGQNPASPFLASTMDKLTYSTDLTAAAPASNLTDSRLYLAASSARENALPQPYYPAPVFV